MEAEKAAETLLIRVTRIDNATSSERIERINTDDDLRRDINALAHVLGLELPSEAPSAAPTRMK